MSLPNPKSNDRKKISEIKNLPVLPRIAKQLLNLKDDENAGVIQLTQVIGSDPVLAAQFLKASNAAFFVNAREITSLEAAINRIGFSMVLNIALASCINQTFDIPKEGPIGMRSLWQNALYSGILMHLIANKIPQSLNINRDTAYLCGLLHNIGFIILGDQFREEFNLINNNLQSSNKTLVELEDAYLGISHCELGVLLMRNWGLPAEIVTAAFAHHNETYKGQHWQYASMAYLCDYLLKDLAISDMSKVVVPDKAMENLHLNEADLQEMLDKLNEQREAINQLVDSLFSG